MNGPISAKWTHRRTWSDHRINDRVVPCDGVVVARVYQHEHGPETWSGHDNTRSAAMLDEALNAVRDRCRSDQFIRI